jgi:hypothetical protein
MDHSEDILFFAFRYSLGRRTYAVSIVTDEIKLKWPTLSLNTKTLIKKEILEYQVKHGYIGDEHIDHPLWLQILNLDM